MEEVHLRTAIEDSRGRQRRVRLYGEASPITGNFDKLPAEVETCKRIASVLEHHYPGHPWAVAVNADQGLAIISIPDLLGPNWGFNIHLDKLDDKIVMEAGGHILERFKIARSGMDVAVYLQKMKDIPLLGMYRAKDRHRIPT